MEKIKDLQQLLESACGEAIKTLAELCRNGNIDSRHKAAEGTDFTVIAGTATTVITAYVTDDNRLAQTSDLIRPPGRFAILAHRLPT
jgi:hypothetical protein